MEKLPGASGFRRSLPVWPAIPAGLVAASVLLVAILKWVPVTLTPLMLVRTCQHLGDKEWTLKREWVPIENISDNMARAVIASEDQKFFIHNGFDFEEISKMQKEHEEKGKRIRGCSTISQQTAKNCFTFCTGTWARKGIEAWYTFLIERIWGKKRIMEVYLNVAETGPGLFGVQAAAEEYFHKKALKLSRREAATIAVCLPNPIKRNPARIDRYHSSRRDRVERMSTEVRLDY